MRYRYASIALLLAMLAAVSCAACGRVAVAAQTNTGNAHSVKARKKARSGSAPVSRRLTAQQRLTTAVAPLIQADGGQVAVTTGTEATSNGTSEFATASIVKVDILATLLYELQRSGQTMTDEDQDLATTMIENSDNDAASALYADIGGAEDLDQANQVFGLTGTIAGPDGEWGLTSTTVLRQIMIPSSVLSPASQDDIQDLMGEVETDQQWGVPAAADPGSRYLVKNGWLPNPALWSINSIGEIEHDQDRMLVAVLSAGNSTEDSGISAVQAVVQRAADAMADG
jgi:beta-lactamase class A